MRGLTEEAPKSTVSKGTKSNLEREAKAEDPNADDDDVDSDDSEDGAGNSKGAELLDPSASPPPQKRVKRRREGARATGNQSMTILKTQTVNQEVSMSMKRKWSAGRHLRPESSFLALEATETRELAATLTVDMKKEFRREEVEEKGFLDL